MGAGVFSGPVGGPLDWLGVFEVLEDMEVAKEVRLSDGGQAGQENPSVSRLTLEPELCAGLQ